MGWWLLIIAFLPWLLRIIAGFPAFQRTPFDLPLAIFLLTAAIGVWAAYDRETALAKFWLLVAAVLLFYVFAGTPKKYVWLLATLLGLVGIGISGFFFLTNDWLTHPAKIAAITKTGLWWMKTRPSLCAPAIHPNDAAGISALAVPLLIAISLKSWRAGRNLLSGIAAKAAIFILLCIFITTSRGAWLALSAVAVAWLLWGVNGRIPKKIPLRRGPIFGLFLILFLVTGAGVIFLNPSVSQRVVNALPNTSPELNRLDLAKSGLKLIGDFPFTGGGLESFPGLFSHYILDNPNFITSYIHNIFLDITLEQGILGLAVAAWVLFGSIWLLVRPGQFSSNQLLRGAILTGLLIMIIHGLEDNIVYYTRHVPLLFLLPGMAVAITLPEYQQVKTSLFSTKIRQVAIPFQQVQQ